MTVTLFLGVATMVVKRRVADIMRSLTLIMTGTDATRTGFVLTMCSLAAVLCTLAGTAHAATVKSGTLVVQVKGLPRGQRVAVKAKGPGLDRSLTSQRLVLKRAKPGRYVITTRNLQISRDRGPIKKGGRAFPRKRRIAVIVRRGRTTTAAAAYGTIVNPGVARAPKGLLAITGDPASPSTLVYRDRAKLPGRGAILTAAPSSRLPAGLVAKVTASKRRGDKRVLSLKPVAISAAVPAFDFNGSLALRASPGADVAPRRAVPRARSCDGPKDIDLSAKLNEFTLRHASSTPWPPQMSFTVAVRTTERIGPRVAAIGVSCNWNVGTLGPWQGAILVFGIPIPVYASIPVDAAASIEGSLSAFHINVASTSVLGIDVGQRNHASFTQEGTNVWVDGALQLSGKAKISATMSLQLGIGNPKIGDLHVKAGFGPAATWTAGIGCALDVDFGALSVGVKIGTFEKGTPPWTPFKTNLWRGCKVPPPGPGPGASPPPGSPQPPGPPGPGPGPEPSEWAIDSSISPDAVYDADLAVAGDGEAMIVWKSQSRYSGVEVASRVGNAPWSTPTVLEADSQTSSPSVQFDRLGNATAVWARRARSSDQSCDIRAATRERGRPWQPAVTVADEQGYACEFVQLAVGPQGQAAVIWTKSCSPEPTCPADDAPQLPDDNRGLWAATRQPGGAWSASTRLGIIAQSFASGEALNGDRATPRIVAIDASGAVTALWPFSATPAAPHNNNGLASAHRSASASGAWTVNPDVFPGSGLGLGTPSVAVDSAGAVSALVSNTYALSVGSGSVPPGRWDLLATDHLGNSMWSSPRVEPQTTPPTGNYRASAYRVSSKSLIRLLGR